MRKETGTHSVISLLHLGLCVSSLYKLSAVCITVDVKHCISCQLSRMAKCGKYLICKLWWYLTSLDFLLVLRMTEAVQRVKRNINGLVDKRVMEWNKQKRKSTEKPIYLVIFTYCFCYNHDNATVITENFIDYIFIVI